jgi:serine/threonine protein phosphatase 1
VDFLRTSFYQQWVGQWSRKSSSPVCINPCETGTAALPPDMRVYAIGNIHGMSGLLTSLLELICEDAAQATRQQRMIIVLCGDFIDRGPDSAGVLSILCQLASHDIETVALRGNHEDLFQRFMDEPVRFGPKWLANGGDQTLQSYGVAVPSGAAESYLQARDSMWRRMPMSHSHFLMELQTSITIGDYFFCHSGARPGVPLEDQQPRDLLWTDGSFVAADHPFEKVIVHGDHARAEPLIGKYRIGIDTNAQAGGTLTAAVLDQRNCRFLQASA